MILGNVKVENNLILFELRENWNILESLRFLEILETSQLWEKF